MTFQDCPHIRWAYTEASNDTDDDTLGESLDVQAVDLPLASPSHTPSS